MDPQLLEALTLPNPDATGKIRPVWLLVAALILGSIALAGPAWEKQPTPFAEDQAATFIIIKVTPSMLAQDIQPSRLQRAVQKTSDFLELKPGQRAGLIAYAGSAHLAMPLTSDAAIINTFAAALEPDAMPVEGDKLVGALQLANQRLVQAGVPGSILLLADSFEAEELETIRTMRSDGGAPVHVLAMAGGPDVIPPPGSPPAAPLDLDNMKALARAGGGSLELVTPDNTDVRELASAVERGIRSAPGGEQEQWKDMGYFLLPFLLLLLLPFFRPGGAMVLE